MSEIINTIDRDGEEDYGGAEGEGYGAEVPETYPQPDLPFRESPSLVSPESIRDYVAERYGDGWKELPNPDDMNQDKLVEGEWHVGEHNLTAEIRESGDKGRQELHDKTLAELQALSISESIAEKDGKLQITIFYAEGDNIRHLVLERDKSQENLQSLPDDGDGLAETAPQAVLIEPAVVTPEDAQELNPALAAGQTEFVATGEIQTLPTAEPIPEPQAEEAFEQDFDLASAWREEPAVQMQNPAAAEPEAKDIQPESRDYLAENLDDYFEIRWGAKPEAVTVMTNLEERLLIDAGGYEVLPETAEEEEKKPDIFELTQTEEIKEELEPYLREMNRHVEVSLGNSPNGFTVIENPTVSDIKRAEKLYEQDLKNEQLYGGLTEEAFNAKKIAVEREKEEEEEEQRQAQEQNRRQERRYIEEQEEEEETMLAHKALEAAAGEAISSTEDKEIKDRGDNGDNIVNPLRIQPAVEQRRAAVMEIEAERTGETQEETERNALERITGISLARMETEPVKEQQNFEPEPELIQKNIPQNSPAAGQRDEQALSWQNVKSSEIKAIEDESGIKIVLPKPETPANSPPTAELFAREAQTAPRMNPYLPTDDLGGETEYAPGAGALELAA